MNPSYISELPDRVGKKLFACPETGCWIWQGTLDAYGYATIAMGGRVWKMHRLVYTLLKASIPDDYDLHHKCRNRCCANPDHCEPLTKSEHTRRGDYSKNGEHHRRKTHCDYGHEFTPENTRIIQRANGKTQRRCRACTRKIKSASKRRCRSKISTPTQ